jgi:ribose/xylose/arabinose/galactoside ABC-type transport system permease subunit
VKKQPFFKTFIGSKIFTLLLLFALIVVAFAFLSGGKFLKLANLRQILQVMVVTSILTVGAGCLMISGKIDLSTGANGTMCGMILAYMLQQGMPWPIAVILAIMLGAAVGLFNAMLVNELNFQPFIATLATTSIAQGFTYVISNARSIPIENSVVVYIGTGRIRDILPVSIIISLAALVIYGIILSKTKFGRSIYLVGGNPTAAMLSGINPKRMSYILFANCGAFGSLAGCLLAARVKAGTVNGILNSQFSGITAAILGGVSFGGGSGGMGGAFVGLLILNGFNNGMTVLGINPYWQTVASGVLLLIALTLDYIQARSATGKAAIGN